jgi:hypothetical protein
MRFYYISLFSLILLAVIYVVGTGLLLWFGAWLRKRMKKSWVVMAPLFALLYIGPIAEEFWIAWNFGHLCKKDAGIFIYKTVEVEGFYDDTHSWRADKLEAAGFRWMEGRDRTKTRPVYWRHEWVGKEIRSFQIDHPTARYHYKWPNFNTKVSHKIYKQSEEVTDTEVSEILGGSIQYGRKSPWYFVALDDPGMSCPSPGEDPLKEPGLVYKRILKPIPEPSRRKD